MQFTVWIVSPTNYSHSHAFDEVAIALRDGLIELGHEVKIVISSFECRGKTSVLGANLLAANLHNIGDIPKDMILYNLEQMTPGSPWITEEYISLMRGSSGRSIEVWDYSRANIEELKKLRIEAKLCEIGLVCAESLSCIEDVEPEFDVLHYGSMTERRLQIISDLAKAGVRVHAAFGVYGAERDALIARSKIVLNIHFYESKVFEIVRCSYLMSNRKCVVSETGVGGDEFDGGIYFSSYNDLVDSCVALLADDAKRGEIAQRGFEIFEARKQATFLKGVL